MMVLLIAAATLQMPATALAAPDAYEQGVAARLAGHTAQAIALLEQAVAADPKNADAQLQLGLALLAADRLDEADAALQRTLALAPGYQDAKDAMVRLAERRSAARQAALRSRIDVDGTYSALQGSAPDWLDASIGIRHDLGSGTAISAAVEPSRRFGRTDVFGDVRVDQRLSAKGSVWLSVGGTPNADFRPEWEVAGGGSYRLNDGPYATVLTAEGREARYPAGDVQTLSPGIEQYVGGGSWLTARMINVFDRGQRHSGWLARGDWMASQRTRLFAGAADAPDVSEGIVTRVFSLFGGVSADVSERTTLRLSIAHEDRARSADRLALSAGVGWRF